MQIIVIIQRSLLVYLAKAMLGTGLYALLSMRFLIQKNPQKHLDYCTWLSVMGMKAGCYYCGVLKHSN